MWSNQDQIDLDLITEKCKDLIGTPIGVGRDGKISEMHTCQINYRLARFGYELDDNHYSYDSYFDGTIYIRKIKCNKTNLF